MTGEFDAEGLADAITAARRRGELPSLTPLVDSLKDHRSAAEVMRQPIIVAVGSGERVEDVCAAIEAEVAAREGAGARVVRVVDLTPRLNFDASRALAEGVAAMGRAVDPPSGFRAVVREKRRREKCKRSRHGRR